MNLDEQIEFVACMAGWFPDDKLRQLADSLRELKELRARVAEHDRALERACALVMDRSWATGHASDAAELMTEVLRQADEAREREVLGK